MVRGVLQRPEDSVADWLAELRSAPTVRPIRWAQISGQAKSTVYDQIERGDLPTVRFGHAVHILTKPLLEILGVEDEAS